MSIKSLTERHIAAEVSTALDYARVSLFARLTRPQLAEAYRRAAIDKLRIAMDFREAADIPIDAELLGMATAAQNILARE